MLFSPIARLFFSNKDSSRKKRPAPLQLGSFPRFEQLEDRLTPATVTWSNPNGGSWETGSNWNVGHAPQAGDDVVITGLNSNAVVTHSANGDVIHGLTMDSNVTLTTGSLTITGTASLTKKLLTINAGATLNFSSGASVLANQSFFSDPFGIRVAGTLNATNTTFGIGSKAYSSVPSIQVSVGGRVKMTGSTFAWTDFNFDNGSLLSSGDITGNTFASTVTIPVAHAPLLANNLRFQSVAIQSGTLTTGQNITLAPLGSETQTTQKYVFNTGSGTLTITSGATLNIANGTTFEAQLTNFDNIGIVVNGTLNVTGSKLTKTGYTYANGGSYIEIKSGGRLKASGSTFEWTGLSLASGSLLSSGDIVGNTFNQPITIPVINAPLLTNNLKFTDVYIQSGNLTAGQNITLSPLGSDSASQRYVFGSGTGWLNILVGATLNITNNTVLIGEPSSFGSTCGIIVSGTLIANGADFRRNGSFSGSSIEISAGGRLKSTGSSFAWNSLSLANDSLLSTGDITGNAFYSNISIPLIDVPLFADNLRFLDVIIQPGSLTSGHHITLAPLGTMTQTYQRFIFNANTGNFTIQSGATLTIAPGTTLVADESVFGSSLGISVAGTLDIKAANLSQFGSFGGSFITIKNGGRLVAKDTFFDWSSLTWDNGSKLDIGDVTGNIFSQSITIPAAYASRLSQNDQFEDVIIQSGGIKAGESVTLSPLGTVTTANQRYIFNASTGNFTIPVGATLNVTGGASLVAIGNYFDNFGIFVNGSLNVDSSTFSKIGSNGTAFVQVNSGGHLTSNASSFGWSYVNLVAGSIADLQYSHFLNMLAIDSKANIDVFSNDFSALGTSSIIASGNSTSSIDLRNNYWGTITSTDIAAKISDHADSSFQPTVLFDPYLTSPPYSIYGPALLTGGASGGDYLQSLQFGTANQYTITRGSLPTGMTLSSDGKLQGMPTSVGSFAFTVNADDLAAGGTFIGRQVFFLTVAPPIIQFTQTTITFASADKSLNLQLQLQGGIAPYRSFTVSSGTLPVGLTLTNTGLLQGIPTGADGTYEFTISAQDSTTGPAAPYGASQKFTLLVDRSAPTDGSVFDTSTTVANFHTSRSKVSAKWGDFGDNGTGIASYKWAIGTNPGSADVMPFTDAGLNLSATTTGLNLNDGIPYYISVKCIDMAGNFSATVSSSGFTVDSTSPTVGTVNDGNNLDIDVQFDRGFIGANWAGFGDNVSGIASYQWGIGTTPGSVDIQSYKDVGLLSSATTTGLNLVRAQTYFVSVRAVDNVGNISVSSVSNGLTIAMPAPVITGYSTDASPRTTNLTNDRTPTLQGTAEPGSTIQIFEGSDLLGTGTANSQGIWSITTTSLADGPHSMTTKASDPNGTTSLSSDTFSILVDTVAPTVQITRSSSQTTPTNADSVTFEVTFDAPVVGFTASAIDFAGSTVGGNLIAQVSGDKEHYLVTVTGMTGVGTIIVSVRADAIFDQAGNGNLKSNNSDNTVAYDHIGPGVTISHDVNQPSGTQNTSIVFHVKFSEPVTGFGPAGIELSNSTVGGSLIASISGSGADYTVEVNGMYGAGNVVLSIKAGAAVDSLDNASLASSAGNNVVRYNQSGVFELDAANYVVSEGDPALEIIVHRRKGSEGPVSIHYSTTDGTAVAGKDFDVSSGTLTWADGDTNPKSFFIPIIDDNINESAENFTLALDLAGSQADLGSNSSANISIAKSDGKTIKGSDRLPTSTFTDADGDLATILLAGKVGSLTYYLNDGHGPISNIELQDTDSTKSIVSLSVRKPKGGTGDGRVIIGSISGTGAKSISLAQADLTGAGIDLTGYVGSLNIGSIQNGADISLAGAPFKKGLGTSIVTGVIGNGTDIAIKDKPLTALTATSVGIGNITAPSIGSIRITGKAKTKTTPAIPGDFKSNIKVAGTGLVPKVPAIRSIYVVGAITDSQIAVGGTAGSIGDIGVISTNAFVNSQLFVGYTGPADGSGSFSGGTISSFNVVGRSAAFSHSHVIANNMTSVSLASVDQTQTGSKFGFTYHTSLKAMTVRSPKFKFAPKGALVQAMSSTDFEVKKM